jgi:hypothetical protein
VTITNVWERGTFLPYAARIGDVAENWQQVTETTNNFNVYLQTSQTVYISLFVVVIHLIYF